MQMFRRAIFWPTLLFLFILSSHCGSSPATCQTDADCPHPGDLCQNNICVSSEKISQDGGGLNIEKEPPHPDCQEGQKRSCYTGPTKTRHVGSCKDGEQTCIDGKWGPCKNEVLPEKSDERNGLDDDCDGTVDEGASCNEGETRSCYGGDKTTRTTMPCHEGIQRCVQLKWNDVCEEQVLPQKEVCNGIDDDCNGQIDDNCPCKAGEKKKCYTGSPKTRNKGICHDGEMTCQADGTWGKCQGAQAPQREDCNGKDDDCDGTVDEGCGCRPAETRDCYTGPKGTAGIGECTKGTQTCDDKGKWGECVGQKLPKKEICNGKDDDCNGQIDDNLTPPKCSLQDGVCAGSLKICGGHKGWLPCDSAVYAQHSKDYEENETKCDGKDNNCDGLVDEQLKRPCYTGKTGCTQLPNGQYQCVGSCQAGTQTCHQGTWGQCSGQNLPTPETCNEKDNDCNGIIDDGCNCKPGTTRSCYSGPHGTAGQGICKAGTQTCNSKGQWGSCIGQVTPKAESCNGQDDDCNGKIDDGLVGPPCAKKSGVCAGLRQRCGGQLGWLPCTDGDYKKYNSAYEATETLCDGQDNDCDGEIDKNLTRSCYRASSGCLKQPDGSYKCAGICQAGHQSCLNGHWSLCSGDIPPKKEICGNLKDDDCNGQVDDCNAVCQEGKKRPCYTDSVGCIKQPDGSYICHGSCHTGYQICQNGQWTKTCTGEQKGSPEICNWKDDDCNGKIDDNGVCLFSKWTEFSLPTDLKRAVFLNKDHAVAIGKKGKIWNSFDGGRTWRALSSTPTTSNLNDITANNGLIAAVGDNGTILVSLDNGHSFIKTPTSTHTRLNAITIAYRHNSGYPIIAVGENGLVLGSKDNGRTFSKLKVPTTASLNDVAYKDFYSTVVIVGDKGTILRSTNAGQQWSKVTTNTTDDINALAWSFSSSDLLAVGERGLVLQGSVAGYRWKKIKFPESVSLKSVVSTANDLFAIPAGDHFYLSLDKGNTFQKRQYNSSQNYHSLIKRSSTSLYAIGTNKSCRGEGPIQFQRKENYSTLKSIAFTNYYIDSPVALAVGYSGLLYRSQDGGLSWQRIPLPTSSSLYSVSLTKQAAVIVGSAGIAFFSNDLGKTWTSVPTGTASLFGVTIYEQYYPKQNNIIAVGTGNTIVYSVNNGKTWKKPSYPSGSSTLYAVSLKDSVGFAVGSGGTVYRTLKAGVLWNALSVGVTKTLYSVCQSSSSSRAKVIIGGSRGLLLISLNRGTSWKQIQLNTTSDILSVAYDGTKGIAVGRNGAIFYSTDSTLTTWKAYDNPLSLNYYSVSARPKTREFLIAGERGIIQFSNTPSSIWLTKKAPSLSLYDIVNIGGNSFICVGENITRTDDFGQTWNYIKSPTRNTLYALARSGRTLIAAGRSGTIIRSADLGKSWTSISSPTSNVIYDIASTSKGSFIAVGSRGLLLQSNVGGTSFSKKNASTSSYFRGVDCSGSICIAVGSRGMIQRSSDYGNHWSTVKTSKNNTLYKVAFSTSQNVVIVGSIGTILYSDDAGKTWKTASTPTSRSIYTLSALAPHRFLAIDSNGKILASGDGGKNWTTFSPNLGYFLKSIAASSNKALIIGYLSFLAHYQMP